MANEQLPLGIQAKIAGAIGVVNDIKKMESANVSLAKSASIVGPSFGRQTTQIKNGIGDARGVFMALGLEASSAGGQIGGAAQKIVGAFGSGGPVVAAITVVSSAIIGIATSWERAEKAREKYVESEIKKSKDLDIEYGKMTGAIPKDFPDALSDLSGNASPQSLAKLQSMLRVSKELEQSFAQSVPREQAKGNFLTAEGFQERRNEFRAQQEPLAKAIAKMTEELAKNTAATKGNTPANTGDSLIEVVEITF